jgi:hypothetical protein
MTVKRSEFATYLNIGTIAVPDWALLGDGITAASINYNPQTSEETYIHQDTGTTEIESYKPTMPIEATCKDGDDAWEYLDTMRKARAVLDDAVTEIVNVWLYETPTTGAYPAEKQGVSIQFDEFGGDGGASNKMSFTINYQGDPVVGTFNPTTLAWTAS